MLRDPFGALSLITQIDHAVLKGFGKVLGVKGV